MDVVAGSDEIALFNAMWRIRAQPTGLSVEAVLQDHVGAGVIFRRLQHIVLDPDQRNVLWGRKPGASNFLAFFIVKQCGNNSSHAVPSRTERQP